MIVTTIVNIFWGRDGHLSGYGDKIFHFSSATLTDLYMVGCDTWTASRKTENLVHRAHKLLLVRVLLKNNCYWHVAMTL